MAASAAAAPSAPPAAVDFIEITPAALSREQCAALVARFEAAGDARPGRVGSGVLKELKDSDDIQLSGNPAWADAEQMLNQAVFAGLLAYLRRYRYALIAPLMLQQPDPATGALLVAPTAFTHTHRGNTPLGADKYIATSWVLFQRAEVLFPPAR